VRKLFPTAEVIRQHIENLKEGKMPPRVQEMAKAFT
jgi:hypothetical protein